MAEDLKSLDFELSAQDVQTIEMVLT
jgi:hypothetical protein